MDYVEPSARFRRAPLFIISALLFVLFLPSLVLAQASITEVLSDDSCSEAQEDSAIKILTEKTNGLIRCFHVHLVLVAVVNKPKRAFGFLTNQCFEFQVFIYSNFLLCLSICYKLLFS